MNNRLRVLRAEKRISQEQLAAALKVHRQSIFAIENKKYVPSTLLALRLALFFEKKVEEVFSLEEGEANLDAPPAAQ
ncbi:helix-turn-helix transcriptional regulator [soil metagenome]